MLSTRCGSLFVLRLQTLGGNMTFAQILAFLGPLASSLEPILLGLETNTVQPELQKLIASVTSPDLKLLLQSLDAALDAFIQAEIKNL